MTETDSQDITNPHFGLVKRPEQQQIEKIRRSRQRASGSLQIRDANTPFLPVPVSLSVCFLLASPPYICCVRCALTGWSQSCDVGNTETKNTWTIYLSTVTMDLYFVTSHLCSSMKSDLLYWTTEPVLDILHRYIKGRHSTFCTDR